MALIVSFIQVPPSPSPPSPAPTATSPPSDILGRLNIPSSGGLISLGIVCGLLFISVGVLFCLLLTMGQRMHKAKEEWDMEIRPRMKKRKCKTCKGNQVGRDSVKSRTHDTNTFGDDAALKGFHGIEQQKEPTLGTIRLPPSAAHPIRFRRASWRCIQPPTHARKEYRTFPSTSAIQQEPMRNTLDEVGNEGEEDVDVATDASQAGTSYHDSRPVSPGTVYIPHPRATETESRLERRVTGQIKYVEAEYNLK